MKYILKVSDNHGTDVFGPFNSHRDAVYERTQTVKAYGYSSKKGFQREADGDTVIFRHAIYSTVIFEIQPTA